MKDSRTPNCISLDQVIAARAIFDSKRAFINCLSSIDLEMRFRGTILCELDDLYQTPPKQSLVSLCGRKKRAVGEKNYMSEKIFSRLK